MKTFLKSDRPIITGMLKSKNKKDILAEIRRIRADGAEAYGFQIENLEEEFKSRENLKEIFDAMYDKPIYCTNYMRGNKTANISWNTLSKQLLMAVELGATLIDIPADMFNSSDMELSMNKQAIEKQVRLIEEIHHIGGEVLMSSHVLRYIPKEVVLTIAEQHKARGADISKIVTEANSISELNQNFEIQSLLESRLGIKHLFLCNGTHCRKHRLLGPLLGSCLFLTTENAKAGQNQPTVAEAIRILKSAEMYTEEN